MSMTEAERKAAARKAADTRRKNQAAKQRLEQQEDPHKVETQHGSSEADAGEAHDVPRDYPQEWKRASDLEAPPPRPGFVQRWIRTAVGGKNDPKNANKKFREGWKPRLASTVPGGFSPPTIAHGQFGEVIGVEDMVLCEMPVRLAKQRDAFYLKKSISQNEAVERDLHRAERPGMPIRYGNRTQVEKGPGRVPKVQGQDADAYADDPDFQ